MFSFELLEWLDGKFLVCLGVKGSSFLATGSETGYCTDIIGWMEGKGGLVEGFGSLRVTESFCNGCVTV